MKNEVRSTMIASVVMIGILTAAGIISYMIIKRRKKEIRDTETVNRPILKKINGLQMSTKINFISLTVLYKLKVHLHND